jgi:hypothetical protein
MSKILKAGECGWGLLIEHDAGYINNNINPTTINEEFKIKPNEPILIDCILQKWGVKNKNGRIYPKDVLITQVNEYQKFVDGNCAGSEVNHPDSSIIALDNISHIITKMWWGKNDQENVLFGQLKLIVSPGFINYGVLSAPADMIVLLLQNKFKIGISSRGVGSLKNINGEDIVQNDFELIGFDLVSTPSTPGAYLLPNSNLHTDFNENILKRTNNQLNEDENKIVLALNKFLL